MFTKTLVAGWGDMDFNQHMAGPAFLFKCFDVRLMYFAENGFPLSELLRLNLGPVGMKDEVEYVKEVGLLQEIAITLTVPGMSADGSRWQIRQDVLRADGKLCARVTSAGGWMDLAARKLVVPPEALHSLMKALMTSGDFVELPSSLKNGGP